MLKANASRARDLDLKDFRSAFKNVDWKSFRNADFRGTKDVVKHMRRDHDTERRNGAMVTAVGAAAVGAALMYFFDPGHGESRRSVAGVRLKHWYLSGRGQIDHGWRQLQSESRSFDLTEKGRSGGSAELPAS